MTEQTIIVDEGDKQIGIKDRSEISLSDICRSSGLWIENSKGQVLLAKRRSAQEGGVLLHPEHWRRVNLMSKISTKRPRRRSD